MKIIVDSSVAVGILRGKENCCDCLNVIRQNSSYKIVSCADWASQWLDVLKDFPNTPVHRDFLITWQKAMVDGKRIKYLANSSHPCLSEIRLKCEESDKSCLYLIAVTINTDCYLLYCSLVQKTCDRILDIEHPAIELIKENWKKSELPETVQWLLDNA